jgi:hypothetical protein
MYVMASKFSGNHFISEKYKNSTIINHISIKTAPLCNYTLLPATEKVLETFLEVILRKASSALPSHS